MGTRQDHAVLMGGRVCFCRQGGFISFGKFGVSDLSGLTQVTGFHSQQISHFSQETWQSCEFYLDCAYVTPDLSLHQLCGYKQ